MSHTNALRGVSAGALTLVLLSVAAEAQEALPTIDIGATQPQQDAAGQLASGSGNAAPTGPAAAHPPAEDNTTYRPENSMTATKTNTPIMDTPASIQIVPRAVLNDQKVTEISQAINNVSGVLAADERQTSVESFFIRGFLTSTYYLDGVRMNSSFTNSSQNMANIDRVEVLKGPASILYGRGDPGGIVNLVTKQPLEKPYTAIEQQIGSWSDYRTTLDTTGPLTADNTLLYRLNLAYENNNYFFDNSNSHNIFVAPTFRWNIDPHTYLNVYLMYTNRVTGPTGNIPAFTGPGPTSQDPLYALAFGTGSAPLSFLPRSLNGSQPWSRARNEEFVTGYSFSRDLNQDWNLRHKFQVQLNQFDFPGAFNSNWNTTTGIPFQLDQYAALEPANRTYGYYTSFELTGKVQTGPLDHTILVGSDYQHFNQAGVEYFAFAGVPTFNALLPIYYPYPFYPFDPGTRFDFAFHESWWGAFLQDQIKLPYNVFLLAGARYDRISFFDDVANNVVSNAQRVTPRFGLLWRPIPELSVYGSYLTNFGPSPFNSKSPVPPESAQQWEVGVKTELFDKRLTATIAYYDLIKQNIATVDPADPTGQTFKAIGEARNRGVELDVAGEVVPGLKVIGGYSYIASIITKDAVCDPTAYANFVVNLSNIPGGCVVDAFNLNTLGNPILLSWNGNKGKRLGGVPRHAGSLFATYEIQSGDLRGLKFGGGVLSRSLAQGDDFNDFHTPGYARVNLLAAYETKIFDTKTTFQLNVNNLLNTRYYYNGFASPFGVVTGTPRNFKGSIKVEF